ncbi:septal ring lytic transglycosylase RlpA family protein [Flavobacterium sp. GT3R68]|uniref:septal ring lytic transglycosylase RlpA family protein n=1 Tax=Flavobacterium sp. GT3R68 TaxID=2594437 RepID=UPI000F897C07|nr:septal ring lytic transglycosylase RlpA family protein [Flavobacterium sp. GT3R68]RTY95783.1 septal ring lytic transglycosylase RlpA family protein [Flavobacterium sp. GSN2]TRW93554.1 septal ring lytic transglycosylase RlpA family protein [Flavobacterium sp. GT3R68]
MKHKSIVLSLVIIAATFFTGFCVNAQQTTKPQLLKTVQDTAKSKIIDVDSLKFPVNPKSKLLFFKNKAHASYYADKFNGRRTTSGKKFSNNSYTAAHRKFAFGTKLKVTNEANGKSVIVEITDRGPFIRGREIDLTKRAFMDIANNKGSGSLLVTIELVLE